MQFQFPEFTDRKLQNWQQYSTKEMKIDSTFFTFFLGKESSTDVANVKIQNSTAHN